MLSLFLQTLTCWLRCDRHCQIFVECVSGWQSSMNQMEGREIYCPKSSQVNQVKSFIHSFICFCIYLFMFVAKLGRHEISCRKNSKDCFRCIWHSSKFYFLNMGSPIYIPFDMLFREYDISNIPSPLKLDACLHLPWPTECGRSDAAWLSSLGYN